MTRSIICVLFLLTTATFAQQPTPARPKITGIDHVAFYTTSAESNERFYMTVLGLVSSRVPAPIDSSQVQRFVVGSQWIGYSLGPAAQTNNRMDHVAFATVNCAEQRAFLAKKGVKVPPEISSSKYGFRNFSVSDPEGNKIEFVEHTRPSKEVLEMHVGGEGDPVSHRLIHTGFIVHDRAAEDLFYKDILGFHLYWFGGMKPDRTDWVAMQVPDGTDWLEYMLNQPNNPDLHLTGVMNHISLGVKDMKAAQAKLESHGWKPHGDEHSQMGKDGKWQLNLFDPDQTRVELMEFTPAEKPCCSEFQGPHPTEPN